MAVDCSPRLCTHPRPAAQYASCVRTCTHAALLSGQEHHWLMLRGAIRVRSALLQPAAKLTVHGAAFCLPARRHCYR